MVVVSMYYDGGWKDFKEKL